MKHFSRFQFKKTKLWSLFQKSVIIYERALYAFCTFYEYRIFLQTSQQAVPLKNFSNTQIDPSKLNNSAEALNSTESIFTSSEIFENIITTSSSRPTQKSFKDLISRTSSETIVTTTAKAVLKEYSTTSTGLEDESSFLLKAVKGLQEENSTPDDDFIHFVQTALRKSAKMSPAPSNIERKAPLIIKKLISISPRLRTRPSTKPASISITNSEYISGIEGDIDQLNKSDHLPTEAVPHYSSPSDEAARHKPSFVGRLRYEENSNALLQNEKHVSIPPRTSEFNFSEPSYYSSRSNTRPSSNRYNFQQRNRNQEEYIPTYKHDNRANFHEQTAITSSTKPEYFQRPAASSKPIRKRPVDDFDTVESRRQAESAKYSFSSDVQDDINGNLHQRQETRDGTKVTGSYTYEDGFFRRTVHYVADENGYRVIKYGIMYISKLIFILFYF